jgi:hypothetical protein
MARRDTWARTGELELRLTVRAVPGEKHDAPAWSEKIRLNDSSISAAQAADRTRETVGQT